MNSTRIAHFQELSIFFLCLLVTISSLASGPTRLSRLQSQCTQGTLSLGGISCCKRGKRRGTWLSVTKDGTFELSDYVASALLPKRDENKHVGAVPMFITLPLAIEEFSGELEAAACVHYHLST